MNFTETTIKEFFRKVGNPAAGQRLVDHLREENLILGHPREDQTVPLEIPKTTARRRRNGNGR